jgi:AcrR family transcriptional regulator
MTSVSTPIRSHARANRERLIEAARDAFTAGEDVAFSAIAKRAGVGQATLYRHFPTRDDLVMAVYQSEIDDIADLAPRLLAEHEPLEALDLWLERLAAYGPLKYGAAEAIHAATNEASESRAWAQITGAIRLLLDAGVAAGEIRPDVTPDDLLLIVSFLWRIDPSTGGLDRARRMLRVVRDGLTTLPPPGGHSA